MDADSRSFIRERWPTPDSLLATSVDDRPHVAPVRYTCEERGGEGVFSLLTGRRERGRGAVLNAPYKNTRSCPPAVGRP